MNTDIITKMLPMMVAQIHADVEMMNNMASAAGMSLEGLEFSSAVTEPFDVRDIMSVIPDKNLADDVTKADDVTASCDDVTLPFISSCDLLVLSYLEQDT